MGVREFYKIFFFSIPFDAETRSIYDDFIIKKIKKKFKKRKLKCVIGNEEIGMSRKYEDLETFKMQNSDLFKHFVKQIRESDIVIADLTANNPNVHVELGIALFYNKNILRVTRQSYEKIAFDVRNYKCAQYNKQDDLFSEIDGYLTHFFKIKDLDFKAINASFYYHLPEQKELGGWKNDNEKENAKGRIVPYNTNFQMRDGKIRVTFKIEDQIKDEDWFGVFLRTGDMGPQYGSCLVYMRKNGSLEIATYILIFLPEIINSPDFVSSGLVGGVRNPSFLKELFATIDKMLYIITGNRVPEINDSSRNIPDVTYSYYSR